MSDEEELSNAIEGGDDFGAVASTGSKGGGKGGLIKILSWVAGIVAATIFIVTVVVVTIKIMDRGNLSQSFAQVSESYNAKPPILKFYGADTIGQVRGRTSDKNPLSFIIKIDFGYPVEKEASLQTEITQRLPAIQDMVRSYFNGKKAEELMDVANEETLKLQLKEQINRILTYGPIVEVVFTQKDVFDY